MAKPAPDTSALTYLKALLVKASTNRAFRDMVTAHDAVLQTYGKVFSPEHLPHLQEQEFREFLLFKNNRHWTGLHRHADDLCRDMERLRRALSALMDEARPLSERLDYAIELVAGMGKAVATAVLHVAYPEKYGVWNNTSEEALRSLGLWPSFPRGQSTGQQYAQVNRLLLQLARELQTDLWTLDALLWYATTKSATRSQESTGARGSDSDQPVHRVLEVWWVNQGQTFRSESRGGYFWAPLQDRRGATPVHWRRMEQVRPGDIVLHYSEGFIRAVSRVQSAPEQALYPDNANREYGQRVGNLIRTSYSSLVPPVPRAVAATLTHLPASEHPFLPSGAVQQGYLYRFGVDALRELVTSFATNWPSWVTDVVAPGAAPPTPDHAALRRFIAEIRGMNLGVYQGVRRRYKPLMLLAAVRCMAEETPVAFSEGNLIRYYRQFAQAVHADSSHPEYPYYHLTNDGFWSIVTQEGSPFTSHGTPNQGALRETHIEIPTDRAECIRDARLRPYVLGALKTYFEDPEWTQLAAIWPELNTARAVGNERGERPTMLPPEPLQDLEAITASFHQDLEQSNVLFDPSFVRAFVTSLATKPFAILTGLSGSGKTQLALQFGRWLGEERVLIVPVRPDWTGSDALFGYQDALLEPRNGRRAWHVPLALEFMLRAARDPHWPYLLILDEMNLAHVERYFADVLSGMESGEECLPNLVREEDGLWRMAGEPARIPFPRNLFVVGTVNVDETTYMFSPKVLDRANTLEFRVATVDLSDQLRRPVPCPPGPGELVRGFLAIAVDPDWHVDNPHPERQRVSEELRRLHAILHRYGFEFGHRVFTESLRFAAMLAAAGESSVDAALDAILMQKVLPRLHGNRRRLEPVLEAVGAFAFYPETAPAPDDALRRLNLLNPPNIEGAPRLARSFAKLQRMMSNLQAN